MDPNTTPLLLWVGPDAPNVRVVDAQSGAEIAVELRFAPDLAAAHAQLGGPHEDVEARDLEAYRRMSSASQSTTVTAALARSGALSMSSPAEYEALVAEYIELLEPMLVRREPMPSRAPLRRLAAHVGRLGGGPRDLLDIHIAAIDRVRESVGSGGSLLLVSEARLLALELMGLLADYYRVRPRWSASQKVTP